MPNSLLRALVDLRDKQIQKGRIQFSNRLHALVTDVDNDSDGQQEKIIRAWTKRFNELETQLDQDISNLVKDEIIYDELSRLKGIGPMLSAKLIAMIDIHEAKTVSALWKYSGYGVGRYWVDEEGTVKAPQEGLVYDEGEVTKVITQPEPGWTLIECRDRPVKGFLLPYNRRLKTSLYLIASSFLKCSSPYRLVYDNAKLYYGANRDWTKAHIHRAAIRKMLKIFLSHLWERWRLAEGLEIRVPYVYEKLGHTHKYQPEDFGWKKDGD